MKTILIKDFVANDKHANELITDFTTNKLVIKGSTGIGGTTSILNITDKTVVIISPLNGMIDSKLQKKSDHQIFIHGKTEQRWSEVRKRLDNKDNFILNTTADQIIELKKNDYKLYNQIITFPFFVDEFDVYADSDYRKSFVPFYNILFNELKANFTLSTATPSYKNLDIPMAIQKKMEFYVIKRQDQFKKDITIDNINGWFNFAKEECDKGNKVILFTNDKNQIKNLFPLENQGYKIQTLVGDLLATKLSTVKSKKYDELTLIENSKIDDNADIYVLSTKYLIGFDIEFDASVGIIVDATSMTNAKDYKQVIQAYGRVRKTVTNAKIFYREQADNFVYDDIDILTGKIKALPLDEDYLVNAQPLLRQIHEQKTFRLETFKEELEANDFIVTVEEGIDAIQPIGNNFREKYLNLINQEEYINQRQFKTVCNHIKGDFDEYNGFGTPMLLLFATAHLATMTGNKYLLNTQADRYDRLLTAAKAFIDANEYDQEYFNISKVKTPEETLKVAIANGARSTFGTFKARVENTIDDSFIQAIHVINYLYAIEQVQNDQIDNETSIIMEGFRIVSEVIIEDYIKGINKNLIGSKYEDMVNDRDELDKLNTKIIPNLNKKMIFKNTNRNIINRLEKQIGQFENQKLFDQIMKKGDDIKNSLLKNKNGVRAAISSNTYSITKQKENHKLYLLSFLSYQVAGHRYGFRISTIDNREFNQITKCTRQLRKYTPYTMIENDIKSAFPSFIDKLVGSNLKNEVYKNIEDRFKCSRDEAKKRYNMMLNDNTRLPSEMRSFFTKCGYTKEQVEEIVKKITVEKGAFYKSMTKIEEEILNEFMIANNIKKDAIRCHDAAFCLATTNNKKMSIFNIGGIEFGNKLF